MKQGYIIVKGNGNITGRVYSTRNEAERIRKAIIKNNSLEQRKYTGHIHMRVENVELYDNMQPVQTYFKPYKR